MTHPKTGVKTTLPIQTMVFSFLFLKVFFAFKTAIFFKESEDTKRLSFTEELETLRFNKKSSIIFII